MTKQTEDKLNWLQHNLPEGLIVDAAWMTAHGYSTPLRTQYVAAGWLSQPARRVYQRRNTPLTWQQVVISLQTLLSLNIVVAGISALEHHGFAHYARRETGTIHLAGPDKPPTWLKNVLSSTAFRYRNDIRLFQNFRATTEPHTLTLSTDQSAINPGLHSEAWGPWNWPLTLSSPERAILELMAELPDAESFHQVDMIMEGLSTLSPRKLAPLLADCRNIKVKRLFLFFARRHNHAWFKHIDQDAIDLGRGKRMIVKGGRLDPNYQITVPGDLDAV